MENVSFQIVILIFSNICCWQFQCVPTMHVFSINEFFTISFFKTNFQSLSFIQRNEHVEMNKFSCSLSFTWMTITECLFYASAYLEMFHENILLNC